MLTRFRHLRTLRRRNSRSRRGAFTLVELMISVAIVLVLMLGINYVFSTSARTISQGMAVSNVGRDIRNARRVIQNDFDNAVDQAEMPGLIIHSEVIAAFLNKQDLLTDQDYDVTANAADRQQQTLTYDVDGAPGDEIDMTVAPYDNTLNHRRHRADRISFFAEHKTGEFRRQTGDSTTYVSGETSQEAWINYGLLRLATDRVSDANEPTYGKPGADIEKNNPLNFFASQWILGRRVILLKNPPYTSAGAAGFNSAPVANRSLNLTWRAIAGVGQTPTTPFNREDQNKGGPYQQSAPWRAPESRIDMANATLAQLRTDANFSGTTFFFDCDAGAAADIIDYTDIPTTGNAFSLNYLSWAKPFVVKPPPTLSYPDRIANQTREVALTTPIFLRGVTQFIVEFAGDFYDQGPTPPPPGSPVGTLPTPEEVGTVDYVPFTGAAAPGSQIRWYGRPRDTDGGDTDNDGNAANDPTDVQPLSVAPPAGTAGPVQRWVGAPTTIQRQGSATLPYIFAWGTPVANENPQPGIGPTFLTAPAQQGNPFNVRPSMIRITIEVIDANGRLPDGQRIEYVFNMR